VIRAVREYERDAWCRRLDGGVREPVPSVTGEWFDFHWSERHTRRRSRVTGRFLASDDQW
jgi:hypothetical protein